VKDIEKDFTERTNYHKTSTRYFKPHCKACSSIRTKEWQEKNRERYNKYARDYYHSGRRNKENN